MSGYIISTLIWYYLNCTERLLKNGQQMSPAMAIPSHSKNIIMQAFKYPQNTQIHIHDKFHWARAKTENRHILWQSPKHLPAKRLKMIFIILASKGLVKFPDTHSCQTSLSKKRNRGRDRILTMSKIFDKLRRKRA